MDKERILQEFPLAVKLIEAEEGFRSTPYQCTAGAWTIGFGTNLDARHLSHEGLVWTEDQALDALLDELEIIISELDRRWPQWRKLNDARRAAVLSSVYQLGIYGAASFKNTIAKLLAEDFSGAADNLLASKWAKQTPQRVHRNADIIRSGILPQEVNGVQILPAPANPGVGQTQSKSPAPVLSVAGSGVPASGGSGEVPQVRAGVPASVGIKDILKALSKSKTMGGVVGLLVMQLFGMSAWDVAIRVGGQIYTVPDLSPYIATALAGLATWGRITAKQINEGKSNA